jgi:hypothetical protein
MLELGIPVGAGTDATCVASYNPWLSLYWLVAGKTVGGTSLYSEANRLSREEALKLYTQGIIPNTCDTITQIAFGIKHGRRNCPMVCPFEVVPKKRVIDYLELMEGLKPR